MVLFTSPFANHEPLNTPAFVSFKPNSLRKAYLGSSIKNPPEPLMFLSWILVQCRWCGWLEVRSRVLSSFKSWRGKATLEKPAPAARNGFRTSYVVQPKTLKHSSRSYSRPHGEPYLKDTLSCMLYTPELQAEAFLSNKTGRATDLVRRTDRIIVNFSFFKSLFFTLLYLLIRHTVNMSSNDGWFRTGREMQTGIFFLSSSLAFGVQTELKFTSSI